MPDRSICEIIGHPITQLIIAVVSTSINEALKFYGLPSFETSVWAGVSYLLLASFFWIVIPISVSAVWDTASEQGADANGVTSITLYRAPAGKRSQLMTCKITIKKPRFRKFHRRIVEKSYIFFTENEDILYIRPGNPGSIKQYGNKWRTKNLISNRDVPIHITVGDDDQIPKCEIQPLLAYSGKRLRDKIYFKIVFITTRKKLQMLVVKMDKICG